MSFLYLSEQRAQAAQIAEILRGTNAAPVAAPGPGLVNARAMHAQPCAPVHVADVPAAKEGAQ